MSEQTFCRWQDKHGGMEVADAAYGHRGAMDDAACVTFPFALCRKPEAKLLPAPKASGGDPSTVTISDNYYATYNHATGDN